MKRILSVILSLALLASLLIIPMSVSAETSADDHISAIQSAAAGLQLNEAQKEQFYTPLGIFSNNATYKTVCENVITNEDDKFTVGSKVIKLPVTFGSEGTFWEIPAGTDAVVSYQPGYVVNKLDDYSVKIPKEKLRSISFSVKTNIALTIDLRVHNGSMNYATKKINISASDNWQELEWDVSELGVAGDYIGSIFAVVNDENTNKKGFDAVANGDDAKVYFGGMFAETNVPDENVTAVNNAENLADCIVAAEKIDTSRYTDETVTDLKSAITAAKTALIKSYTDDSAALAKFVNSEIGVLSKTKTLLIGVFGQYYSGGSLGSATVLTSDLEAPNGCVPKNLYLSADENWRYISGNLALLEYVSPGVTEFTNEGMGAGFTAGDYDDIYIYVVDNSYTSRSEFTGLLDQFGALSKPGDWVGSSATGFVNAVLQGLDDNGHTKIFAHKTKLPIKSNGKYITSIYDDKSVIKGFQILKRNGWTDGSEIGFSPMYGVKYCKETVAATSSREIYNGIKAISVNDWDNGAILTETADIITDVLGITSVKVVKVLDDSIGIQYNKSETECTFEDAVVGKKVSFRLTNVLDGVNVTVKYGEVVFEPVDGVYTIPVEKDKVLYIIPSHKTTTFAHSDGNKYYSDIDNLIKNAHPAYVYLTNNTTSKRTLITTTSAFSDGTYSEGSGEPGLGMTFTTNSTNSNFINGYTKTGDFDFTKSADQYTAFVDVIYDLGCVADINKVQHFGHINAGLTLGAYQVYASTDTSNLFDSKSLVVNYQNKTSANSQQHEFPTRSARFVAFRVYCPVTADTQKSNANSLRVWELAIYGTQTDAYKVTEISAPTDANPISIDTNSLLNSDTLKSIKGYENNAEIANIAISKDNDAQQKLHSGTYSNGGHGEFKTAVFYDTANSEFKNGFVIDRSNLNGNIIFTHGEITTHSDFTYDLGSYYKINRFELYSAKSVENQLRTQSYEVYIGNNLDTLYDGDPVAVYNNYYNTYGQKIEFAESHIGKYLGVRILMPADRPDKENYVRLDELAAYGTEVGAPDDSNLAPAKITSNSVYILNAGGKSIYTSETDGTERTALRLTVGYKSPKDANGFADASQIVLKNGDVANVIERNVVAVAHTKYDGNGLDIHCDSTKAKVTTATGDAVKNYFKSEAIADDDANRMTYGALNLNNISKTNAESSQVVVRGRVVYEYNGEIYAVYSNIVGADGSLTAQAAYEELQKEKPEQGWFN